ncbi:exosome complex component csl4-like protein [Trifolium pratense]|uniref:Exosome complex component csl4-like protein n=1 Tax=Trifolium pratense TaxID=57577 RepID=A0A2K3PEU7_TRIPR|nr:exosome complex component csl4-like protein [Trifolium pratense]
MAVAPWADSVTSILSRRTAIAAAIDNREINCQIELKHMQQDVRATEIDKVDMHLSFRPGDIVKALVLSLGNARAYFLSTAKNELGVVSAESTAVDCVEAFPLSQVYSAPFVSSSASFSLAGAKSPL